MHARKCYRPACHVAEAAVWSVWNSLHVQEHIIRGNVRLDRGLRAVSRGLSLLFVLGLEIIMRVMRSVCCDRTS